MHVKHCLRYFSFALMQDVSLVSMRPLVMLLDGGPATFLAQNKSTGFVITTNVSWYKLSPWLDVLSCMSMRPRNKVFMFSLQNNSCSSLDGQIIC